MERLRKNQKEMLEMKNTVTQMKNAFNGFSTAKERVSELQDMLIETSKTKKQREERLKKNRTEYLRTVDNCKR